MAAKRAVKREPTLRDEIAASGETPVDAAEAAERADREDFAFLAREFLAWLCWHADVEGGTFEQAGEVAPFAITVGARVALRAPMGGVTDVALKGPSTGLSADLRYALAGGLSVREVDLALEQGDRRWTFGLSAENFDLKRVKLPELLSEEDSERVSERLQLIADLDGMLKAAYAVFLHDRLSSRWQKQTIPALRDWLKRSILEEKYQSA